MNYIIIMSFDLYRALNEFLSFKAWERDGENSLISQLIGHFYFSDFEVIEQLATLRESYQTNIIGFKGDLSIRGGLLIASNLSVPPPKHGSFLKSEEKKDGFYCYPEEMDSIVDFILKCFVSSTFEKKDFKKPLILSALFGKEALSEGLQTLFQNRFINPDAVLFYVPSNLAIIEGHPGYEKIQIIITCKNPYRIKAPFRGFFRIKGNILNDSKDTINETLKILSESEGISIQNLKMKFNRFSNYFNFDILTPEKIPPPLPSQFQCKEMIKGTTQLRSVNRELLILQKIIVNLPEIINREIVSLFSLSGLYSFSEGLVAEIEFKFKKNLKNGKKTINLIKKKIKAIVSNEFVLKYDLLDIIEGFNLSHHSKSCSVIKEFLKKSGNEKVKFIYSDNFYPTNKCIEKNIVPIITGPGRQKSYKGKEVVFISNEEIKEVLNFYKSLIKYFCITP